MSTISVNAMLSDPRADAFLSRWGITGAELLTRREREARRQRKAKRKRVSAMRGYVIGRKAVAARRRWAKMQRSVQKHLDDPDRLLLWHPLARSLGECVETATHDRSTDPESYVLTAELCSVLRRYGVSELADVAALDENTLGYLRHVLVEQGLVGIRITDEERKVARPMRAARHSQRPGELQRMAELAEDFSLDLDESMSADYGEYGPSSRHKLEPYYRQRKRVRAVERSRGAA